VRLSGGNPVTAREKKPNEALLTALVFASFL
jgi:hypothetical protein